MANSLLEDLDRVLNLLEGQCAQQPHPLFLLTLSYICYKKQATSNVTFGSDKDLHVLVYISIYILRFSQTVSYNSIYHEYHLRVTVTALDFVISRLGEWGGLALGVSCE